MPPGIQECLDSVKRVMPDYDVVVHSGADMDELVPEPFSIVERTNLFRLRQLYRNGGWWMDADCYALRPVNSDQLHSFGEAEVVRRKRIQMRVPLVDWAFGSEAGNPDLMGVVRLLGPFLGRRRSNVRIISAAGKLHPSLGQQMAKQLGGGKLEPFHVYGSRRFSRRSPSKLIPRDATLVHLFLGSWYRSSWRNGVSDKLKEVMRW